MGESRVGEEKTAFLYSILFVAFKVSDSFKNGTSHMDLGNDLLDPNPPLGWPQSFGTTWRWEAVLVPPSSL